MSAVGDRVFYVPDATHWNDPVKGRPHAYCFELTYLDGTPVPNAVRDTRGMQMDNNGNITNAEGKVLKIGKPLFFWDAIVEAIHPDNSADLSIQHPDDMFVHRYPTVPYSAEKVCHSWHE